MKIKYLIVIVLALLAATVAAFYYSDLPAWDLGMISFHHKARSPTTTPISLRNKN